MPTTLTPNLMAESVNDSIAFYRDRLGFRFVIGVPFASRTPLFDDPDGVSLQWAMVALDGVNVMFQARDSFAEDCPPMAETPLGASLALYLEVEALDPLLARLGDEVERVVPERVTFYGMREVWIRDLDGYLLVLAEKVAEG